MLAEPPEASHLQWGTASGVREGRPASIVYSNSYKTILNLNFEVNFKSLI